MTALGSFKRRHFVSAAMAMAFAVALAAAMAPSAAFADDGVPMYRMYNPNSGERFYTADDDEAIALMDYGWQYEGVGWTASDSSDWPVYRLYSGIDHHYTLDAYEATYLIDEGWAYEGVGWFSADDDGVPLYRQFNPNATGAGAHNYTADVDERDYLIGIGWEDEGVGWYGLDENYNAGPIPGEEEILSLNGWWVKLNGGSHRYYRHNVDGVSYYYHRSWSDDTVINYGGASAMSFVGTFEPGDFPSNTFIEEDSGYIFKIGEAPYFYVYSYPDVMEARDLDGTSFSATDSYYRVDEAPEDIAEFALQYEG